MDFSSFWKLFAVVLAAIFTVWVTFFDIKDKNTGKVTIGGKIFFLLTFFSALGGLYAQWNDNASELERNRKTQEDMLSIIKSTNTAVYDLSRVRQPIDSPKVGLVFGVNCDDADIKQFCQVNLARARIFKGSDTTVGGFSFQLDWTNWPTKYSEIGSIRIYFFKYQTAANTFADRGCFTCDDEGDMSIQIFVDRENMLAIYDIGSDAFSLIIRSDAITPTILNDNIMSTVDIPGSTVLISATSGKFFDRLSLKSLSLTTDRGQNIDIKELTPRTIYNTRLFYYQFPSKYP